jgi:O-antigen/teichoic acid export membrane protein
VLKVVINAILVRRYQLLGVAVATVASSAIATAMRFWGGGRYEGGDVAPKESSS